MKEQYPQWIANRKVATKVMNEFGRLNMYGKIAATQYGILLLTTEAPEDLYNLSNLL